MNDTHDFTHDEADPFEALLKRADALKDSDDIGLEGIAKAAIEAKTSDTRLDKLIRVIAKAVGFSLPAVKKAFDGVRAKLDRESQAKKQADPSVAAAEAAARQAALDAEKAAREAEHERLWQSCKGIALAPNLLNRMALLARQAGVIGEVSAIKGTYIVVTSRLMRADAISLLRRGSASAGKNFLLGHVTALIPQESLITVTGASATGLVYFGDHEDSLKGKVILIPEAAAIAGHSNGDENPMAVLVRSLLSEGHIDRIVTIPQRDGEPRAVRVRRNGPVAVLMTSARENVDPEMLTRLMVCDADESFAQTKAVIRQNWSQQKRNLVSAAELETWRDFQLWLEFEGPYDVAVPFGDAIYQAFSDLVERTPAPIQLRMRRDSGAFLTAIKSSAVIHKAQRQTDSEGRLVAEMADYRHAYSAFNPAMSALYGVKVRPELVAVAKAAEGLGATLYIPEGAAHDDHTDSVKITVGAMRQALGINSNDVVYTRMQEALDAGILKQDESRKGVGRGGPRYFWLLRTSQELKTGQCLGVFPAYSSVKKFLEGGPDSQDDGQDGLKDGPNPSHPSYPSYPPNSGGTDKGQAAPVEAHNPSYPSSPESDPPYKKIFSDLAAKLRERHGPPADKGAL